MASAEEERLLTAMRERPDDDGPRLIYADWLSERGDPRGELIVLDLGLPSERGPRPRFDPRPERLATLKESERLRWPAEVRDAILNVRWERGFVVEVNARAEKWPRESVREVFPLLERVTLSFGHQGGMASAAERLRGAPSLAGLRGIEIGAWRDAGALEGVVALVEAALREGAPGGFAVGFDWCAEPAFDAAARVVLPGVRALSFVRMGTSLARLDRLAAGWGGVESLVFGSAGFTSEHVAALSRASLPSLVRLSAASNQIGSTGLEALARAPWLARLSSLALSRNRIGHRGVSALATARAPALRRLGLDYTSVGDRGAAALASSAWVGALEHLTLAKAQIGDAGARALCAAPLDALVSVDLTDNALSDEMRATVAARFGDRARLNR